MSRLGETGNDSARQSGDIADTAQQVSQNLRDLGSQVREAAKEKYEQYSGQARNYYGQGRDTAQEWEQGLESYVHEQPVKAVMIAAGVGLLLGLLWRR